MESIKILGIDPSLRNTGLAIVEFNTQNKKFSVNNCQVLVNPQKYTGTDAILNMLDMIKECSKDLDYITNDAIIVESPPTIFNKAWAVSAIASIAHISGGAAALFDLEKTYLFRPTEWNRHRKKQVTHNETISILGDPDTWNYKKRVKSEKYMEHILDAASMALFWIKSNYMDD